ncbi:orotate phosphoribosyltransferase [Candidatus Hydrogenedentota bacterium]
MTEKDILAIYSAIGALHEGHFLLSSGRHSDRYLQSAIVLQSPQLAGKLGTELAHEFEDVEIDIVAAPAIGGIIVAHEVARALGAKASFTEREDGKMTFRRGIGPQEGDRILVVEDIVTTGGSVKETVNAAREWGAEVVGVGVLIDRSGGQVEFDVPFKSLAKLNLDNFAPESCPLCEKEIPITKPGSRDFSSTGASE